MPKSAVVDASVLVSAFLFRESVPGRVIELAEQKVYTLYSVPTGAALGSHHEQSGPSVCAL